MVICNQSIAQMFHGQHPELSMYQIEFTDQEGRKVRTVPQLSLAMEIAKSLAIATGHRAIITKLPPPSRSWTIKVADTVTGEVWTERTGLSKRQAGQIWRAWNASRTACVVIAWPEWLPEAKIQLRTA